MSCHRWAAWLAGVWTGILACIGAMAAPAAFATLVAGDAGHLVARLFAQEAYLSLAAAVLLILLLRVGGTPAAGGPDGLGAGGAWSGPGRGGPMSPDLLLVLGTVFCTVAGYFAVQPLMAAARAGEGRWSFAALHAASGGLFVLKGLLVAALAWRLAPRRPAAVSPGATS